MAKFVRRGSFGIKGSLRGIEEVKKVVPPLLGDQIQKHFRRGFDIGGGQTDASRGGWPKRKMNVAVRSTPVMISTGRLKRDIRVRYARWPRVRVGTSAATKDYAEMMNEGGTIRITPAMRRAFFGKAHTAKQAGKPREAEQWRYLGMHRGSVITIPKREYIGRSRILEIKHKKLVMQQIDKHVFKI